MLPTAKTLRDAFLQTGCLPTGIKPDWQACLSASGVEFGPVLPDNPQLQQVTLPTGWSIVPVDERKWHEFAVLLDDRQKERAMVFFFFGGRDYQIVFFLQPRYQVAIKNGDHNRYYAHKEGVARVLDGNTSEVYITEPVVQERGSIDDARNLAWIMATEWLEKEFPNYLDPTAYWNDA